ncbi:MAG: hypothetical protein QXD24_04360 [Candidatus Caldarchaeum sp.]
MQLLNVRGVSEVPRKNALGDEVKRMTLRLPPDIYRWLCAGADKHGIPVSVYLRLLLREVMRGGFDA